MKIGYPCINRTIGCKGDRTFRLKSYSERRLIDTVTNNLDCLSEILKFNVEHTLLFFRITSNLVPFASHPVCQFDWRSYFQDQLAMIGAFIMSHEIRISMHPGQYTVLNGMDTKILSRSINELTYHAHVLDALKLNDSAKMQIHVGGTYENKKESMRRFIKRYHDLDDTVKRRLVIENDDRSYTVADCISIHEETGIPVLIDIYHHELNNSGLTGPETLGEISRTWQHNDGIPMVDYSFHQSDGLKGRHTDSIDMPHFQQFLKASQPYDIDIMLEIKDKETSAIKAVAVSRNDDRFHHV
jgi:UV DNA damage endonuclease